jgi:hypothetical protein
MSNHSRRIPLQTMQKQNRPKPDIDLFMRSECSRPQYFMFSRIIVLKSYKG